MPRNPYVQSVPSDYFPIHAHSEFSCLDGMGTVDEMVRKVASMGQPAISLTDHGTMAGSLRLYREAKKAGIAAYPGCEFYVVNDVNDPVGKNTRYHMGMLAFDFDGYRAMVKLSSRSHTRERFHRKPLIDFDDLAHFSESGMGHHVMVTTGCFFGLVIQSFVTRGEAAADMVVDMLVSWFPHLSVEVQHHGIPPSTNDMDEAQVNEYLFDMARRKGLPILLGQDSHYCDASHHKTHDLMKDISYFGDGEDDRFPGGPYHLASVDELMLPWSPAQWGLIEEGHGALLDMHALKMPALDKYKFHVPEMSTNPDEDLDDMILESIGLLQASGLLPTPLPPSYRTRLDYEQGVMKAMGMANYFILSKEEVTDWCRDNNVIVNARGSANGSLVCYVLGITNVDPVQWGTSFDRFISVDRKKPPDIDFDVESRSRQLLIAHLRKRFPDLVNIGTYSNIGITEQEDEDGYGEDKGSVFVQYMAAMRRKKGAAFTGEVAPEHRQALNDLADIPVRKSLGVHAAGLVLPTKEMPIADYLSTGLVVSSETIVTQAVMEDVEGAGYTKLDVLGLRAPETINGALLNIGRPGPQSWIPWNDKRACAALCSGKTDGIFQFEGYATMIGAREMNIRNTMDAIICLALYRPALLDGGQKDMYLANRMVKKADRPYPLDPFFDSILDVTSGVAVFQEQVMDMCKSLGMKYDDWNDLLTAVKASGGKVGEYAMGIMKRVMPIFMKLCKDNGIDKEGASKAWQTILGFTDYGFNRAHATSYGLMAYKAAYLKAHYPLEYMAALLATWAGTGKEQRYMKEARRLGISMGRADVSVSDVVWTIDRTRKAPTLRKGLTTIKGIGVNVACEIVARRPVDGWDDMDAFVDAMPPRPVSGGKEWKRYGSLNGVMLKLKDAGALSSLSVDP